MHDESNSKGDLVKLQRGLLTEADARAMLEQIRWPDGLACIHCGVMDVGRINVKASTRKDGRHVPARHLFKCKACKKQFSVTKGTIFEDSKIPLSTWIAVMYRMCSSKRGVPAKQVEREFGIAYESAWFMVHRIRWAMSEKTLTPLAGVVEADETYIGGKVRGHIEDRRANMTQGERVKAGMDKKTQVFGILERGGRVRAAAITNRMRKPDAKAILTRNIDREKSVLITDESGLYDGMGAHLPHGIIRHKSEYVRGTTHTQGIESFWSILKRGLTGTYYHVDEGYLNQYVQEFAFRHNHRKTTDKERFTALLGQVGGRLDWYLGRNASKSSGVS